MSRHCNISPLRVRTGGAPIAECMPQGYKYQTGNFHIGKHMTNCNIPLNPSPDLQAALKWAEAYNLWDVDHLMSAVSDDYTHHVLPATLGVKPRNKQEFKEYFTSVIPMFRGFTASHHHHIHRGPSFDPNHPR